jgi:hypothetical protein
MGEDCTEQRIAVNFFASLPEEDIDKQTIRQKTSARLLSCFRRGLIIIFSALISQNCIKQLKGEQFFDKLKTSFLEHFHHMQAYCALFSVHTRAKRVEKNPQMCSPFPRLIHLKRKPGGGGIVSKVTKITFSQYQLTCLPLSAKL